MKTLLDINTRSWMVRLAVLFFSVTLSIETAKGQDINAFYDAVDAFMATHVADGLVDYAAIKDNPAELDKLVDTISTLDRGALAAGDEKAYLINAYNVLVIKNVVDNYPTNSPLEVAGFFDRAKFEVSGSTYTLNELEKGDLFNAYPDARLHFVLVCAAIGCPELISEAYRSDTLDDMLTERTRVVLSNSKHVNTDEPAKKHNVSELFTWYKKDFTEGGTDVIGYINQFRNEPLDTDFKLGTITYNWQLNDLKKKDLSDAGTDVSYSTGLDPFSNLQAFTPSTLLVKGQFDVKVFNNLYTQTANFNDSGSRQDAGRRDTYFTSIISLQIGYSSRLNFGLDLYPKAVRVGSEGSSALDVLQFSSNTNAQAALAAIAPKVKFVPFKNAPRLATQVLFYIPVVSDLEGRESGRPFLDFDDFQTWIQAFYDVPINPSLLLYLEGGLFFRFDNDEELVNHEVTYPIKGILNYFPSDKLTLYALAEFTPSAQWQDPSLFSTLYTQTGVGAKFQITPRFEIESLVTLFPFGVNRGAGQTYNIGFRFVR
ncbi:MAG: DUF547 domain-containing protein [Rhodothermaceae bacterium]|nr:DUF547 domain-containing protein [Rhodothermaceae bacterium]